jgi:unsaturated rhamnogalacturonyl hydrolase
MKLLAPQIRGAGWLALTLLLLAQSLASAAEASAPMQFDGATALQWAQRMADSQITRMGSPPKAKWDYTDALFSTSLLALSGQTRQASYADYAAKLTGAMVADDGTIPGYKASNHVLDDIAPARVVLALYNRFGDARYQKAAQLVREQFTEQPRTSDGGFWHKQIYTNQMWLDGLYMAEPFYAAYAKAFKEPADFDDITKQILLADQHTYDAKTGLFYHGWEDTREQSWADKETGHSPSFWARAIGWYAMAIVDVLDNLPADHPARAKILDTLQRLGAGLARWQDAKTGLWWQVVDQGGREGNYLEASGSSMFVYALAKAVNQGYLPANQFTPVAERGFAGLVHDLVKTDASGAVSLTQICETAGLGNGRDGTYNYYVHQTKMINNDLKGVGAFVLAGLAVAQIGATTSVAPVSTPTPATAADLTPAQVAQMGWDALPVVLTHINAPTFADKNFPITDYGAKADGATDCTDAIRQAIEACNKAGGGHVVVPDGTFLTGAIRLLSNVDLHLSDNAKLQFVPDLSKYPQVTIRYEGVERTNCSPPIYALEQENIGVTGKGTIDGGGENNWQAVLRPAGQMRPNFVVPFHCKNVLIEGLTIHNSPMWEINPVYCTNVIVRNLNIDSHDANNDGCDPDSCRYVLIDGCTFDTGDDCIAIKCGKDDDGRRVNLPTEFVIVRNSTMKDGHGGVTLGSECTPAIRNVFIENCHMDSPNLNAFIRFKDSPTRGGIIENVYMRNVEVGSVATKGTGFLVEYTYQASQGDYIPILRNVSISNVKGADIPRLVKVTSGPTAVFENIQMNDCVFSGPDPAELQQNQGIITFANVTIQPKAAAPAPSAATTSTATSGQ